MITNFVSNETKEHHAESPLSFLFVDVAVDVAAAVDVASVAYVPDVMYDVATVDEVVVEI